LTRSSCAAASAATARRAAVSALVRNPRRAYEGHGREIEPLTLANMREHGVFAGWVCPCSGRGCVRVYALLEATGAKIGSSCRRAMLPTVRHLFAVAAALASLSLGQAATAQGVYVPMPGSLPAATGPNLINPSAPASSVDPNALNPSAAPSAVMTPNALNPSATPSTFTPDLSAPYQSRILIGPVDPLYRIVPGSGRRRAARTRRRAPAVQQHQPRALAPRASTRSRQPVPGTQEIMGSVCRGC
jgi:hypothetical protein